MKTLSNDQRRLHFLGWQCRLRQHCVRHEDGRPTPGMRPRILTGQGTVISQGVTTLLVPSDSGEHLAFFKFQVQRTNDPQQRQQKGLEYLQSGYFQTPDAFDDELTAVFPPGQKLAATLRRAGEVVAEFEQSQQTYRLLCAVRRLAGSEPARALSLWHNRLFNPDLPSSSTVLGFRPHWESAQAHPGP